MVVECEDRIVELESDIYEHDADDEDEENLRCESGGVKRRFELE
jgi:hypothetical protein